MNKLPIYGTLLMSLAIAWFAVWNHYSVILGAKDIKPTKWRGDDVIFLVFALVIFLLFTVAYFTN